MLTLTEDIYKKRSKNDPKTTQKRFKTELIVTIGEHNITSEDSQI